MRAGGGRLALRHVLLVALLLSGGAAVAQTQKDAPPLAFQADSISYDQTGEIVTAEGHVEAAYGGRILLARRVTYNQKTGVVTATGEVALSDADGNTVFAENAQLTDDLRDGVIRGIALHMANNARMAANSASRAGGNTTELDHAIYTSCKICADEDYPTWQIRAEKVRHDQAAKRITYRNAYFDVFGVPVFYTPYFSHADPSVKQKSGFLAPSLGSSTDLGTKIETPYLWVINPSQDFTFSPLLTSREGPVVKGEHRARTRRGRVMTTASLTRADDRDEFNSKTGDKTTRGHINARGVFALSPADMWGFNIERATDDTYLKRYDLSSADTLTSRLFTEHIAGRDFGSADFLLFQGLNRDDNPGLTPMILPLLSYSAMTDPSAAGGRFNISGNALVLRRNAGQDTHRVSATGGWQRNYVSALGEVYTLFTDIRGDLYYVDDIAPATPGALTTSAVTGRALPLAGAEWRLPLSKYSEGVSQVVEPIAQLIYSPYGGNPGDIPNEDSGSFEFDGSNLFSPTRFPGYDRFEGGPRANLGAKWGMYGADGGYANILFGQVWRLKEDATFARDTGLDTKRSDYVGSIAVSPAEWFDILHRFRMDRDSFGYRRSEVEMLAGPEALKFNLSYVRLARELTDASLTSREEISGGLNVQFKENWSARALTRRDLSAHSTIETRGGVFYGDECIEYGLVYNRRYTRDRDIEPSTSVGFKINLRTLG